MPTIIEGDALTAVSNAVNASRLVIDMKDKIHLLEPSADPLTVLTKKAKSASCYNPKFEWLEDEATPVSDRINYATGYASTVTELTIDTGEYVQANDLIRFQRTGEVCLVTSVASDVVTCARSFGGTTAAAVVDNDQFTILGGAYPENDTSNTSVQVQVSEKYNYSQIVRNPFGVSRTLQNTRAYGGDVLAYTTKARGIEHAKDIENILFFGERGISASEARRSSGGLDEWISTNVKDFGGGIGSLDEIFDAAEADFRYGSKEKMLFAGRGVVSNISLLAADQLRVVPEDKTYGIHVQKLMTPHGVYNIVAHDLLAGDYYGTRAFIVDMDAVGYRFLQNSDTKLKTNIQAPDVDGRKDEFITEMGLERAEEKRHGKWTSAA